MESRSKPPRVLVVGDNFVGKSLFLHLLSTASVGQCAMPTDRIPSTVGFKVEACTWRSSGGGSSQDSPIPSAIEFVEIGGNRTFLPSARRSCMGDVSAVIFVYNVNAEESAVALRSWFNELQAFGVFERCASFLVLGVVLPTGEIRSPARATKTAASRMRACVRSIAHSRVAMVIMSVASVLEHFFLLLLSWVLFGLSQTVVPYERRISAKQTLQQLEDHRRCAGHVTECQLTSPADFSATREEVNHFLSTVASRHRRPS